jgi:hypothetical protein
MQSNVILKSTLKSSRSSGLGPFKPPTSRERALFGFHNAMADVRAAAFRINPDVNDSEPDRTLLAHGCAKLAWLP